MPIGAKVLEEIEAQRTTRDAKWGDAKRRSDLLWLAVLGEEVGGLSAAILTHRKIDDALARAAAVLIAWREARMFRAELRTLARAGRQGEAAAERVRVGIGSLGENGERPEGDATPALEIGAPLLPRGGTGN